jgi:hypothetical protein
MHPPPLRTDGSNQFARYSMAERVPAILDHVLARAAGEPATVLSAIAELRDDIRTNAVLPPLVHAERDGEEWVAARAERDGESWLGTVWFFAECYAYRCLLQAARYRERGWDPFSSVKKDELNPGLWERIEAVLLGARRAADERLADLLAHALWQNRMDLSYLVGASHGPGQGDDLLCDDRAWAVDRLLAHPGDVHLVADNAGSELAIDLVLLDAVIELAGARVILHVKAEPTFVSDATPTDVRALFSAMAQRSGAVGALGLRLEGAVSQGSLRIAPDFFWNGPRFLVKLPDRLAKEVRRARIVVLKGDANYRRTIGDALWPPETSLGQATADLAAPLLALRTMKSDPVVGLPAALVASLDRTDARWRLDGRRGIIQSNRSP